MHYAIFKKLYKFLKTVGIDGLSCRKHYLISNSSNFNLYRWRS